MSRPDESSTDPLIGQVVDGRYRVRRVIGRGGMGVVYEAEATRLGQRPCALKVLLPEFTRSSNAVARFTREAELAGRVKHPNLVEIFDTGTIADGRGYLVMELLRGEGLDRTLRREGPLPWARAQHIMLQICRALTAAHAEKIVHRDMKPENCFRGERDGDSDFIKVLDFGIAKLTDAQSEDAPRLTATDAVIGTYAYMANEQVRGEDIDHRVDIWALGVMLYEMLTGRLPFRGNNQGQIWTAICSYDPEPMRNIAPDAGIPEGAEAIVRRALARARDDRFQTIDALAQAIAGVHADGVQALIEKPTLPVVPPTWAPSPTFASAPTAAQERPPQNFRTDPLAPRGLIALGPEEAGDTGESLRDPPRMSTNEGRRALGPLREVMDTAGVGLPVEIDPALGAPSISRSRRRVVWPLTGLGLTTLGLVLWMFQGTGDVPAPSPTSSTPPEVPASPLVDPPQTDPEASWDGMPVPAPVISQQAPIPEANLATAAQEPAPSATKKTSESSIGTKPDAYKARVTRLIADLNKACFSGSKLSLKVIVDVAAATGRVRVTLVDKSQDGSGPHLCIKKTIAKAKFGPGAKDFHESYTLNSR